MFSFTKQVKMWFETKDIQQFNRPVIKPNFVVNKIHKTYWVWGFISCPLRNPTIFGNHIKKS